MEVKLQKPDIRRFKGKRKLLVVPIPVEATLANQEIEKFWEDVKDRIEYFENRFGKIDKLYHEGIYHDGEDGMKDLEKLVKKESKWYHIVQRLVDKGAKVKAVEDEKLARKYQIITKEYYSSFLPEVMELHRDCYGTNKWRNYLSEKMKETGKKIEERLSKIINDTLKEMGILFISEGRDFSLSSDIETFRICPPSLDDIKKSIKIK